MSKEDKEWLEAAMKEYTFSDTDKLGELCKGMKKDIEEGFTDPDMVDKLDQVQEMIELHERNNLNLAIMGGLQSVMEYMQKHPDKSVRKVACNTFTQVVQNNLELQDWAQKLGALNLMGTFVKENDMKNKEAVFGSLSSFLRSENFVGKREFIQKMGGLQFLAATMHEQANSERLIKKVLILMYDLVLNDDGIFEDNPTYVRKCFGEQMNILDRLIELLMEASKQINVPSTWDLREFILLTLFRIFQVCPEQLVKHAPVLNQHKQNLIAPLKESNQDQRELIAKEIGKLEAVLKAPQLPMSVNYKKENMPQSTQQEGTGTGLLKLQ